jgi:hypothetical protein
MARGHRKPIIQALDLDPPQIWANLRISLNINVNPLTQSFLGKRGAFEFQQMFEEMMNTASPPSLHVTSLGKLAAASWL